MSVSRSLAVVVALAGCAPKPAQTIPVALLVDGDRAAVGAIEPRSVAGLELAPVVLPQPPSPPADSSAAVVAAARASYAKGDFDACRAALAKVDVTALLATGDRTTAARALTVDGACAWGATDRSAAKAIAERLASFGLALPEIAVSPDVEHVFGDAIAAAGKAQRTQLAISGVAGARLSIDGRVAVCALPCSIDLAPGDHVLAGEADGYQPASRSVRIPDVKQIAIAQQAAPADLAATQWRARVGRGLPPADVTGATLIGKLAKQSRVAYVQGDTRLTGSLIVDGKLAATATRDRGMGAALVRELAYDGGVLQRPKLWQKPWFWIAVSAGVAVVAGTIIAITYQRPIHTDLGFAR
jgi:hypothetical protein